MLAKVDRARHRPGRRPRRLGAALAATRIDGIETNLGLLRAALAPTPASARGAHSTAHARRGHARPATAVEVLAGGTLTTVQDWPGPARALAGRRPAVRADGRPLLPARQPAGSATTRAPPASSAPRPGPTLRFRARRRCASPARPTVADARRHAACRCGSRSRSPPARCSDSARSAAPGLRTYVLFARRARRAGVPRQPVHVHARPLRRARRPRAAPRRRAARRPEPGDPAASRTAAGRGPARARRRAGSSACSRARTRAPEFFTARRHRRLLAADWQVHFNSARTGVRLVGPSPAGRARDGGEAGLHPSNIHDTPYSVGAVDFTGDMPVLLGPDGPSLGGFVCPATVVAGRALEARPAPAGRHRALRPGHGRGRRATRCARRTRRAPTRRCARRATRRRGARPRDARRDRPAVTYRRSGDDNLLVEYGPMKLDLALRMRVHALADVARAQRLAGVDRPHPGHPLAAGPRRPRPAAASTDSLGAPPGGRGRAPAHRPTPRSRAAPSTSRCRGTTRRPARRSPATWPAVRDDAPWCPWNIEFIRRINGLDAVDDVYRIVFDAEYLVLGLGDVYLGAPVATPLDPRHRLVTTKYNPARTWTPENSVGIGGAYLCVYGMEGPGGYQFVGRTVQVWNRFRQHPRVRASPWLLRFFDRIRWYPVSADELLDLRADLAARPRSSLDITATVLARRPRAFLAAQRRRPSRAFRAGQQAAFAAERARWEAAGEFDRAAADVEAATTGRPSTLAGGERRGGRARTRRVWQVDVEPGEQVAAGDVWSSRGDEDGDARCRAPASGDGPRRSLVRSGQDGAARPGPGGDVVTGRAVRRRRGVRAGRSTRPRSSDRPEVWITLRGRDDVLEPTPRRSRPACATARRLPLAGLTLAAVKDNIDVAGLPTTAGRPAFDRRPSALGAAVERLRDGRRGRARQDQPRPVRHRPRRHPLALRRVRNALDPARISGGSSSGSAVAVGARHGRHRARHRHRRLRPGARRVQRHRRAQADPRPGQQPRRGPGLPVARLRVRVRPHGG